MDRLPGSFQPSTSKIWHMMSIWQYMIIIYHNIPMISSISFLWHWKFLRKSIEWVNRPGFLWAGYDHAGPPSRSIFFCLRSNCSKMTTWKSWGIWWGFSMGNKFKVTILGLVKWPFQGLSDLRGQMGHFEWSGNGDYDDKPWSTAGFRGYGLRAIFRHAHIENTRALTWTHMMCDRDGGWDGLISEVGLLTSYDFWCDPPSKCRVPSSDQTCNRTSHF